MKARTRKADPTSWRLSPKPSGWESSIRPEIIQRDLGRCTWTEGQGDGGRWQDAWSHPDRCKQPGTDVDHVGDRDDHRPDNLRLLCEWHHDRRSSAQANAARSARRALRARPTGKHPGLLT